MPDPLFATDDRDAAARNPGSPNASEAQQRRRTRASIEAARHTVLRRLAPALKHDMVVNLQAVSMMAEMLGARLERGGPQAADLGAHIAKLNRLARDAVMTCLKVSTWIDPGEDDAIALHEGVAECTKLMAGSLNFRGFGLACDVPPTDFEVTRSALRNLLAASLITLADTLAAPCELHIGAEMSSQHALLTVSARCEPQDGAMPTEAAGPRVEWADVQALAAAEGVELFRTASQITMRLPRAVASTPLRMAPI